MKNQPCIPLQASNTFAIVEARYFTALLCKFSLVKNKQGLNV